MVYIVLRPIHAASTSSTSSATSSSSSLLSSLWSSLSWVVGNWSSTSSSSSSQSAASSATVGTSAAASPFDNSAWSFPEQLPAACEGRLHFVWGWTSAKPSDAVQLLSELLYARQLPPASWWFSSSSLPVYSFVQLRLVMYNMFRRQDVHIVLDCATGAVMEYAYDVTSAQRTRIEIKADDLPQVFHEIYVSQLLRYAAHNDLFCPVEELRIAPRSLVCYRGEISSEHVAQVVDESNAAAAPVVKLLRNLVSAPDTARLVSCLFRFVARSPRAELLLDRTTLLSDVEKSLLRLCLPCHRRLSSSLKLCADALTEHPLSVEMILENCKLMLLSPSSQAHALSLASKAVVLVKSDIEAFGGVQVLHQALVVLGAAFFALGDLKQGMMSLQEAASLNLLDGIQLAKTPPSSTPPTSVLTMSSANGNSPSPSPVVANEILLAPLHSSLHALDVPKPVDDVLAAEASSNDLVSHNFFSDWGTELDRYSDSPLSTFMRHSLERLSPYLHAMLHFVRNDQSRYEAMFALHSSCGTDAAEIDLHPALYRALGDLCLACNTYFIWVKAWSTAMEKGLKQFAHVTHADWLRCAWCMYHMRNEEGGYRALYMAVSTRPTKLPNKLLWASVIFLCCEWAANRVALVDDALAALQQLTQYTKTLPEVLLDALQEVRRLKEETAVIREGTNGAAVVTEEKEEGEGIEVKNDENQQHEGEQQKKIAEKEKDEQ